MLRIRIDGHLLVPFGGPKWDIEKIRVSGVSTTATYFSGETPCAHVDTAKKQPLRLCDLEAVFQSLEEKWSEWCEEQNFEGDDWIFFRDLLKRECALDTDFERRFLDLYFEYCADARGMVANSRRMPGATQPAEPDLNYLQYAALLPMPQAHLYVSDPLKDKAAFVPSNMVKVDFAFWTGTQTVAVEIDGTSHVGNPRHVTKDRMLQRAGVFVIHVLNSELLEYGKAVISELLPPPIARFWEGANPETDYRHPILPL